MIRLVFFILVLLASTLSLQARSLVLESFYSDIRVAPDGTLQVTETIQPRFTGSWNGIYRLIPVEYETPHGFDYDLIIEPGSITDENGRPLRYETSRERHYLKFQIWVPNAQDATRTVILRYQVERGLRFFEQHDELYWNVTGDESELPIERAAARIYLPDGVSGLKASAFAGGYGSRQQAGSLIIGERHVAVAAQRALGFREGLTVVVGWNPGIVRRPTRVEEAGFFLRANWILIAPLFAFLGMFYLWHRGGRDPRLRSIATQYAPPEEMTPAEVGTLIDHDPGMRDITATLVDLAVRGYLTVEETNEEKLLGLWSDQSYRFHLKNADWSALLPHERKILGAVFEKGRRKTTKMSDLEHKFYKALPDIKTKIYERLLARRCYSRRPDRVKKVYLGFAIAAAILTVVLAGLVADLAGLSKVSVAIAGGATSAIVLIFGLFMPARTLSGTRTLEQILGFEEFLERVESDRYKRMIDSPEMFERYLPFAMALGVEKKWAAAFEEIYNQPPTWYQGGNFRTFHAGTFVSRLDQMSSRASSAMASSPRSSGGSGFSGGSSGGGFGGGGTGGF